MIRRRRQNGLGEFVKADVSNIFREANYDQITGGPSGSARGTSLQDDTRELTSFLNRSQGVQAGDITSEPATRPRESWQNLPDYPWHTPPPGWESFLLPSTIATPAANDVLTEVLSFTVPSGYYGVINKLSHYYTGAGLVPGSGDLTWYIFRNDQVVKNFEGLTIEFGRTQPWPIDGIPMLPGQFFSYRVTHASTSLLPSAGTIIVAIVGGYFYPRQYGRPE